MRVWIDKENEMHPNAEWNDSYVFTLTRKKYSTIFSGITDTWYRMDCMAIPEIYEDLFIIGISVFAIDKRVSRRLFPDCWTRELSVSIPVLQSYIRQQADIFLYHSYCDKDYGANYAGF